MNQEELKEWHKIGNRLTHFLGICPCQRKIKSIVDILVHIHIKCNNQDWKALTVEELLICALLEKRGIVTHGVNCEYPIISESEAFWDWIHEIKHSPYLIDN
jgi:hypothetical protein